VVTEGALTRATLPLKLLGNGQRGRRWGERKTSVTDIDPIKARPKERVSPRVKTFLLAKVEGGKGPNGRRGKKGQNICPPKSSHHGKEGNKTNTMLTGPEHAGPFSSWSLGGNRL